MLKNLSQFQSDLNFQPEAQWPSFLPAYAWQDQLLSGFERKESQVVVLDGDLFQAFHHCHPRLSICELARVFEKFENIYPEKDFTELFQPYGFKYSQRLRQFFQKLLLLPVDFQQWCNKKQLMPNDLAILNSFEETTELSAVLEKIVDLNASKSKGIEILELASELILMNQSENVTEALTSFNTADTLLTKLRRLRKPVFSTQMDLQKQKLNQLSWPANTQAQWQNSGDQSRLELKLSSSGPDDLKNKLHQLTKMCEKMKDEKLWT